MIYNLFDGLAKEEISDFDFEENAVSDDLSCDILNKTNVEKINVFLRLEYNFISEKALSFFKEILQKNIKIDEILVYFVEKQQENAKFAIDWINNLRTEYALKIFVGGELDYCTNISENKMNVKNKVNSNLQNNIVTIYTDGACSGNPGAGGWGAVLLHNDKRKEISGYEAETTNNRMELTAVIKALLMLKAKCTVELYSDSAYVVNAITNGWLANWKNNGWIGSDKKQVKNIELWQKLDELLSYHTVHFNKVKGHADNELNNRCDALATGEIAKNANK